MAKYEVRNVKSFRGMEGYGFNADLHRDGVRIALVIDGGDGGCMIYEMADGSRHAHGHPEMMLLEEHCRQLPPYVSALCPEGMPVSVDMFMGLLVDEYHIDKRLRTILRNEWLVTDGDKILSWKKKRTPEMVFRHTLKNRLPQAKVVNDMPEHVALAVLRERLAPK